MLLSAPALAHAEPTHTSARAALAQGSALFDPARDLEGFEACFQSEFADLYPLDSYSQLLGSDVAPEKLALLRERWTAEKALGDAQLARLSADPAALQRHRLMRELARDRYFGKIAFDEIRDFAPLLLLIQKPAKEDPEYAARTAAEIAPWLQQVVQVFEARYVAPLGLERKAHYPLHPVVILASPGDFRNYFGPYAARSNYDERLRLVVGHADPFTTSGSPTARRVDVMYALVRALCDAHAPPGRPAALALWLNAGLPHYVAYHNGLTPASLDRREVPAASLEKLVKTCLDVDRREMLLFPIEELVGLRTYEQLYALARAQAGRLGLTQPDRGESAECFSAQSLLATHFLQDGREGQCRAAFGRYLRASLAGGDDRAAFLAAFDGAQRASIDAGFYDYLFAEYERTFPSRRADRSVLATLFAAREKTSGANVTEAVAPPAPQPAFEPAKLALDALETEAQHGLALVEARAGDLAGARARLEALVRASSAAGTGQRIAREIARLAELEKLRAGFFESFLVTKAKWSGEHEGKRIVAPVARIEGGFVQLGENRAGVAKLALAAIDPYEVAKQADKKEEQGDADPSARAYAYLLAGDAKWERVLPKEPADGAQALREDAPSYPALLRAGGAAAEIERLVLCAEPHTNAEAQRILASIEKLLRDEEAVAAVAQRLAGLEQLARATLMLQCLEVDVATLLSGAAGPLGDGRIRLVYEFDRSEEANDFVLTSGMMKDILKSQPKIPNLEPTLTAEGGDLVVLGSATWKHRVRFVGPMRVVCHFTFDNVALDSDATPKPWFFLSVAAEGKSSGIVSTASGDLTVTDTKSDYWKQVRNPDGSGLFLGAEYELVIVHDGERATTTLDSDKIAEVAVGPRKDGAFLLIAHCETPLRIRRLELEGKPDPASKVELAAAWTTKRLAEIGFHR